jgi:hypothetical protein
MKRSGIFLFAALCLLPSLSFGLTPQEIYKNSVPAICLVSAKSAGGDSAIGTGFVVNSNGDVATNRHVIEGAVSVQVTCAEKTSPSERYVDASEKTDLVVLKTRLRDIKPLTISNKLPEIGEPIFVIGNPKGLRNSITQGLVSNLHTSDNNLLLQIDAAINPGNSGGPVFNSKGEVVGIATFAYKETQNLNFALSVSTFGQLGSEEKQLAGRILPEVPTPPVTSKPRVNDEVAKSWSFLQDKATVLKQIGAQACLESVESLERALQKTMRGTDSGIQSDDGFWFVKFEKKDNSNSLISPGAFKKYFGTKHLDTWGQPSEGLCINLLVRDQLSTGAFHGLGLSNIKVEYLIFDEGSAAPLTDCSSNTAAVFSADGLFQIKTAFTDAFTAIGRFNGALPVNSVLPNVRGCMNGAPVDTASYAQNLVLKVRVVDYTPVTLGGVTQRLQNNAEQEANRYK